MSADVPHVADARRAEEGETPPTPAGEAHAGSDDDHGHTEPKLGPIDWPAWGYALIGAAAGLLVVVLFFMAISGQPG